MAYACPVCETLLPDGEHLAHHLAITAMSRGGEHEDWLDETVAHWEAATPAELAADVVPHADEEEHELVDDPRAGGSHDHDRPEIGDQLQSDGPGGPAGPGSPGGAGLGGAEPGEPDAAEPGGPDGAGSPRGSGSPPGGSGRRGDDRGRQQGRSIQDATAPFGGEEVSPETAEVLEEARRLTEERRQSDGEGESEDESSGDHHEDRDVPTGDDGSDAADETDSDE